MCLTQAMSCYQKEEWKCFVYGSPSHFVWDCPHRDAFKQWHQEQASSKVMGESGHPSPRVAETCVDVNVRVIGHVQSAMHEVGGSVSHWIGPGTLVDLTIEGSDAVALADSGSQVNTITPPLVHQYGFLVLPLDELVDYPLNLVGLGRKWTSPLSFVILSVQVGGIMCYDEDIMFLVVPDESEFGCRVPLVIAQ